MVTAGAVEFARSRTRRCKMARRFLLTTTAFLALAAAGSLMPTQVRAEDQTSPKIDNAPNSAIASINSDNVYVRSGAGDNYYPTVKLNPGSQVTVVGSKFDWLKVIPPEDRKSTRLNSSHSQISYAVFCLKKKKKTLQIVCDALDTQQQPLHLLPFLAGHASKANYRALDPQQRPLCACLAFC